MSNTYTATQFYNEELSRLQSKQQNANAIMSSQSRLADLNDSYRKRYAKYVQILVFLIVVVLVYLAVVALQARFPSIPQIVVDIVTIVLIFLVAIYLFSAISELYSRSLLNYDELDMAGYNSTDSSVDVTALEDKGQITGKSGTEICKGSECCPEGKTFNNANNKCETFTTYLDYEKVETAYNSVPFNSESLKREPSANVKPFDRASELSYSTV